MSWSLSISPLRKSEFLVAVDHAVPTGQDASLPGMAADIAAAKESMKLIARHVKKDKVGGSASGHCLQEGEEKTHSDHIALQVYGAD